MPTTPTTLRVLVQWADGPIFAGEDVKCKITFKNVAPSSNELESDNAITKLKGVGLSGNRRQKAGPLQSPASRISRASSQSAQRQPGLAQGHRQTLPLNVPSSKILTKPNRGSAVAPQDAAALTERKHQRSLSIISLGGSEADGKESPVRDSAGPRHPPRRGHMRSTSLQVMPKRTSTANGTLGHPDQVAQSRRPLTSQYPASARFSDFSFLSASDFSPTTLHGGGILTAPTTPGLPVAGGTPSRALSQTFAFSAEDTLAQSSISTVVEAVDSTTALLTSEARSLEPSESGDADREDLAPTTKALSALGVHEVTPRSSGDFFSVSNNSTETLASEYIPQSPHRRLLRSTHVRKTSNLAPMSHQRQSEVLMMGYVQIMGSFTLDGSLVNQAPFEEIKRKGIISGHGGGGVVGIDAKSKSGIFGALGWSNVGESIGGLLGSRELSSLKEMRGVANSRSIPLLSTPQSLLFVDLHLGPGESKAYDYSFTLPQGLPPSHKGKAIRISYTLVIGTQRAATIQSQQQVRQAEFSFRVFSGVNEQGETLGHDLLSPHIILKDQARTAMINSDDEKSRPKVNSDLAASSFEDFSSYVNSLLAQPPQASSGALLSPTETSPEYNPLPGEVPSSTKAIIDLAILRSNINTTSARSANRFEIARNGQHVATIMLARPAYRLGETVVAIIDLSQTDIPSYALHAILETAETVDPSLALRSNASIYRVTRKTHASQSEVTLFTQRVVCSFRIPLTATPDFISSVLSLAWTLRVEFITPRITGKEEDQEDGQQLLEELSTDERGTILTAVEGLTCDSFEVGIPLRVYGPVSDRPGREVSADEGLPV